MQLHDLKPNDGAKKARKRIGRGTGSGSGKTAGRGTKGQNSRNGGGVRQYHMGGNLPFSASCLSCVVRALPHPIAYATQK